MVWIVGRFGSWDAQAAFGQFWFVRLGVWYELHTMTLHTIPCAAMHWLRVTLALYQKWVLLEITLTLNNR